ncbi:deaminase [Aureococcus anophagefferens]|nr:deaminase [Aureococcus anophagefferens]
METRSGMFALRLALLCAAARALGPAHRLPSLERDANFMGLALDEARRAAAGEVPVGAVVVDDATGAVVAAAGNAIEATQDASAHAELLALRRAAAARGNWRLANCTLYSTLEPCVLCMSACYAFRVGRVVYGAPDHRLGAAESWLNMAELGHPFWLRRPRRRPLTRRGRDAVLLPRAAQSGSRRKTSFFRKGPSLKNDARSGA